MANLTYNVFTGELSVFGDDGTRIIVFAESGFSNFWQDSRQKQNKKLGQNDYIPGGPIPTGRWRVHNPGSTHPDGGRLRQKWIPVGPVKGRKYIYIHCETNTEGCINIPKGRQGNPEAYHQIIEILKKDNGGWLNVIGGDFV